jgi:hypothetical protein
MTMPKFGTVFPSKCYIISKKIIKNMSGYYLIIIVTMLVSWLVSSRLKSKFEHYSKVYLRNGMSGKEIAEKMLHDNGIYDVQDFGSWAINRSLQSCK